MTRLSHSAANRYSQCPASYRLHYIDRIRPKNIGSALIFGSALDDALNVLLETKLDNPPETATDDLDRLKKGFDYHFTYQMINKEREDVRTSHYIEYFRSDFDPDLLTPTEFKSLQQFIDNAGYEETDPISLYEEILESIKDGGKVDATDLSFYNYCCWLSLKRKGHLMLEHYKAEIMPLIKRVASIQRKVELPNESGDEMIGYIDFEAELYDYEDLGVITIDNKTSSKKYKLSDINDKGQLLVYDEFTENGYGAYIVLLKKIKFITTVQCNECGFESTRRLKNCPEVAIFPGNREAIEGKKEGKIIKQKCKGKMEQISKEPVIESQILVDEIQEEKKDEHFEGLCEVLEGIQKEEFPQIREDNNCFQFGRKCAYYKYCRSSPTDPDCEGLIKG